jgi:UDP-N-acetylmuramate dehydrogenase
MNIPDLFRKNLPALVEAGIITFAESLKEHCSFRIGGAAEVFASPDAAGQLIDVLIFTLSNNINYFILGKGSNLLISDNGISGVVISTRNLNKISHDGNCISAWCGTSLGDLCDYAQDIGLSGLEFASGIPGSVGGAVYMNAGAYGGEIRDVLYCSKYLNLNIQSLSQIDPILHLRADEHKFSYRSSVFQSGAFIHLSSVFRLKDADPYEIKRRMDELKEQRWAKQPMDLPSGGSVFKRPEGCFTGKLIEECGLRGFRIGDAAVSDKHCGFIVNLGDATANDVLAVIDHIKTQVWDRFKVKLETEIRLIG